MALIRPSHVVGAISGSIGSTTFRLTRRGQVLAHRPVPRASHSPAQLTNRNLYARVLGMWHELSDDNRQSWAALARTITYTDRLGTPRQPSAFQLYMQHQLPIVHSSQVFLDYPPQFGVIPKPLKLSLSPYMSSWVRYEITVTAPIYPVFAICSAARHYSDNPHSYPRRWRYLRYNGLNAGTTVTYITTEFDAILGRPQIGELVSIRVYLHKNVCLASTPSTSTVARAT